jgi:hypothetical protein
MNTSSRKLTPLVRRRYLDLFGDAPGRCHRRYSRRRRDDARQLLQAAVRDDRERAKDARWFGLEPIPQMHELAEEYGSSEAQRIHLWAASLRDRRLAMAQ